MQDIRKLTLSDLQTCLQEIGEKPFRAKQIYSWLWQKSAHNISDMTDLSKGLRQKLEETFEIRPLTIDQQQLSNDGTIKFGFRLFDKNLVEGVLIPTETRMTACVSSQVGCSLTCKFCATGYMDRKRNLEAGEIYDQVVAIDKVAQNTYNIPLSNIVFMGMGEPLLNYAQVLKSIEHITSPDGLNMSPKRITVSTAGVAKMIKKLGDDAVKFNLALSLHAANDEKRNQIMPINETNNLTVLGEALRYFYDKTGNKMTFEYIVFENFNDSLQDAKELYNFAKKLPVKINIIEYNPIKEADFKNTGEDKLASFANFLESKNLVVNVRRSRGKDIDAACGQLATKEEK
jgi:23S rRNA (adenine2503-C2)-methyltransferase